MARITLFFVLSVLLWVGCATTPDESESTEPVQLPETTGAEADATDNDAVPALTAAEAEYQARCGGVTITPGLPPAPPQPPSTPGLQTLRPIYEASLALPLTPPPNNSMGAVNEWAQTVFATWVQVSATRLQALDQAAGAAPESDRQHARVWVAHAQALFVERFQGAPISDEIERDPELRSIYVDALVDQGEPLLRRVVELTDGVMLPGAWAGWKAAMQTWLAQEACALH